MKRSVRILSALGLVLALGATSGCVVSARGRVHPGPVVVYEEPPAPREEVEYTQGRSGYVWVRGRYDWQNGQWAWVSGHWERERSGYGWQDGRWERRDGSWHWVDGQWIVHGSGTVVSNDPGRPQVVDHRGGGGPHHGGGGVTGHSQNPDGSGVGVAVGGGHVQVNVHGPTSAPPPIRVENPGAARGGYLWVRGHYEWRTNQYEWIPGHWERQKAGYQWFDGRWELQGNVYVWFPGEWRAAGQVQGGGSVRDRRTH